MSSPCPICSSVLDSAGKCPSCSCRTKKPSKIIRIGLLFIGILFIYSAAGFIYRNNSNISFAALKTLFLPSRTYEISVPPPEFKVAQGSRPGLTVKELERIRAFFERGEFNSLNDTFRETQAAFESDSSQEYRAGGLVQIFNAPDPSYIELLNNWVKHSPEHFAPYLARAQYHFNTGWERRGYKYANETKAEQFEGMRESFQASFEDIHSALSLNPRLLPAYHMLIGIHNAQSGNATEDAVIEKAATLFPDSSLIYEKILRAKLPRWGGSYPEMEALAKQAIQHAESNPDLYMLFGMIYADQAWYARKKDSYDKAIDLYTKALNYGEDPSFLEERARTYFFKNDFERAFEDVNRSIALSPSLGSPYGLRATLYICMEDLANAREDIRIAELLAPSDPRILGWHEWATKKLMNLGQVSFKSDPGLSISKYDKALSINPQDAEVFYWRGIAYSKLNQTDSAVSDLKQAITCDPRYFDAYRMLDSLLASQRRWGEIANFWSRYLALEPGNADAYLERAGTYRHMGDMQAALADLKQACDLGQVKACGIYYANK